MTAAVLRWQHRRAGPATAVLQDYQGGVDAQKDRRDPGGTALDARAAHLCMWAPAASAITAVTKSTAIASPEPEVAPSQTGRRCCQRQNRMSVSVQALELWHCVRPRC